MFIDTVNMNEQDFISLDPTEPSYILRDIEEVLCATIIQLRRRHLWFADVVVVVVNKVPTWTDTTKKTWIKMGNIFSIQRKIRKF